MTTLARPPALAALAAAGVLALAACGSSGNAGDAGDGTSGATGGPGASSAAPATHLTTASDSLGTIVTDGRGRVVYVYDEDTKGASSSACTDTCAQQWPAVHAGHGGPRPDGVTGTVGTITGVDGKRQVTLDGWPLYYFVGDSAAGDVNGQAYDGVWWVVGPDGARIKAGASPSTSGKGGYGY